MVPRVNWTTMNWRSRLQSGVTERMIETREWRRRREFPKGALKIVSSGTMYALSFLFIDNSTHIHCSSRGRPWFPGPTHHYHHSLLPPLLFATNLSRCQSSWFQQNQEAVNWTGRSPLERTQWDMGSTSYHCSTRGDCSLNWNGCLIDAGKPTGSTLQWCARPFYDSITICSPSQISLIINQGSFLHTWGDSEGVQQRWRGQWVRRVGRVCRHVTAVPIGWTMFLQFESHIAVFVLTLSHKNAHLKYQLCY